MLQGKKILLGITGGIAAYKAAILTSKLVQSGAEVKIIMTAGACEFITPLTLQVLSRNEVYTDTFAETNSAKIAHIDLADWADLVVIAPTTANTMAKLAHGIADNMLTSTLLATTAPVFLAPAMNVHMLENKAVCRNMAILQTDGYYFLDAEEGNLACGYTGKGRLLEPEQIIAALQFFLQSNAKLSGKKILITAGPTVEKIDPVRYLSNFSSGKMGYAIAEVAVKMGAEVTLVSGPVQLTTPAQVKIIAVQSADEMYQTVMERFEQMDIIIGSAAVADYKPIYHPKKIKKTDAQKNIELLPNHDILQSIGIKKTKQFLVGFAAETNDLEAHAQEKLKKKNLDLIVANDVTKEGAGFAVDTNIVTFYPKDGQPIVYDKMLKTEIAERLLELIASKLSMR